MTQISITQPEVHITATVVNPLSKIFQGITIANPQDAQALYSSLPTTTGQASFYNLKEDQIAAIQAQHLPVLKASRTFYSLLMLADGTDFSKLMIARNLLITSSLENSPAVKLWESTLIGDILDDMSKSAPQRVFKWGASLRRRQEGEAVVLGAHNRRTEKIFKEFFRKHSDQLAYWGLKYRKSFKKICRHLHLPPSFHPAVAYIMYGDRDAAKHSLPLKYYDLLSNATTLTNEVRETITKVDFTLAEGFARKFGISRDELLKDVQGGKQKSTERQRQRQASEVVRKTGAEVEVDWSRISLFDALVMLRKRVENKEINEDEALLRLGEIADREAQKLNVNLGDIGIIFDNSLSTIGSGDNEFHPMLRQIGLTLVLQRLAIDSTIYTTNGKGYKIFPRLSGPSNYAQPLLQALHADHDNIFILGDGYENVPFEGAAHQVLWMYRKKVNAELPLVVHLNPVYAAEVQDVRSFSSLATSVGARGMEAIPQSVYMAMMQQNPRGTLRAIITDLISRQKLPTRKLAVAAGIEPDKWLEV